MAEALSIKNGFSLRKFVTMCSLSHSYNKSSLGNEEVLFCPAPPQNKAHHGREGVGPRD